MKIWLIVGLLFGLTLHPGFSWGDPGDNAVDGAIQSAEAVCGNDGRFNGADCICRTSGDFGVSHGECVVFLAQRILRAPACDGPLRDRATGDLQDRECGGPDPQE